VIGYDAANGDAVIPGHSAITWGGMLGKRFALHRGQSLDLQLNVENIFGQEDRLSYSATAPDVILRYLLPPGAAFVDVARDVRILKAPPGSDPPENPVSFQRRTPATSSCATSARSKGKRTGSGFGVWGWHRV